MKTKLNLVGLIGIGEVKICQNKCKAKILELSDNQEVMEEFKEFTNTTIRGRIVKLMMGELLLAKKICSKCGFQFG